MKKATNISKGKRRVHRAVNQEIHLQEMKLAARNLADVSQGCDSDRVMKAVARLARAAVRFASVSESDNKLK